MHVAVHSLSVTPSGRPTVLPSSHSVNVQDGTSSTNSPSSSFVAVNRVQTSGSTASHNRNMTNMHTAPSAPEVSALSVAPTAPTSNEQARSTLSSNSRYQERHEDTASAQISHSPTPPAAQVEITNPRNILRGNTPRELPLSPTGASSLHHTTGHNAGQQNSTGSYRTTGACEVTLQQCNLLWLLLRYLFPSNGEKVEESTLLHTLEQTWASHGQDSGLSIERLSDCHREVLHMWIKERRKLSRLRLMVDRQPSAQTLEMVERVLVMNDLRILRVKWKALKVQDKSQVVGSEDLLCRTFAIMTRTEGTEVLFKEGLERLKETSPNILGPDYSVISIYS
jgi:hypothetical protein